MKALEEILPSIDSYDFIEVMNCPGGCIGGGGQPLVSIKDLNTIRERRTHGLNNDVNKVDYCYQNKERHSI